MRITSLEIMNFKSLRDVRITPGDFSVFVGPNNAGKSNLVDAFRFLADIYMIGMQNAFAKWGGVQEVVHRKSEVQSSISFRIVMKFSPEEVSFELPYPECNLIVYDHSFEIATTGAFEDIRVARENMSVYACSPRDSAERLPVLSAERHGKTVRTFYIGPLVLERMTCRYASNSIDDQDGVHQEIFGTDDDAWRDELLVKRWIGHFVYDLVHDFVDMLTSIGAFRLVPYLAAAPGVRVLRSSLGPRGENLPTVLDAIQRNHPEAYQAILQSLQEIAPEIDKIAVERRIDNTMAMAFRESGFTLPWRADELSDGTIQALTMLVAVMDPRTSAVIIDEPENSLHPWILREVMDRMRETSKTKTVMTATHSPIIIDRIEPKELWIVWRENGETRVEQLTQLDPDIEQQFMDGGIILSEFLDSGLLKNYLPGVQI